MAYGESNGQVTDDDTCDPERSSCDSNMLSVQYRANSWRCYLATIANY